MSHPNSIPTAPAMTERCPRCEGRGQARYARPGGWIAEPCTPCRGGGRLDSATADVVRRLMDAGDAALGPAEGPCCQPETEPCIACHAFDLAPAIESYEPSEEDEEDYRRWCQEREERLLSERMTRDDADRRLGLQVEEAMRAVTFQQMLADLANAFLDHPAADVTGIGGAFAEWYDEARALEARSWEQFRDRRDAVLDAGY